MVLDTAALPRTPLSHLPLLDCRGTAATHGQRRGVSVTFSKVSRRDIAGIWVAFFSRLQRYRCGQEAVSEPGDCLFHDLLCGHCGSTNTSPVPRLAIVDSFTATDEA